ncbi:hypothetical protein ILUMI_05715 [Ignelater luminosus]|uniref:Uroporphyrinogen-III synthase n=1 Tax=Ignelater luminosus TaxID=2038154 RepID=A0A8K0GJU4_IGNLU|nr:hypothetical protein ILUMI_05715 [Ignelater luminosus]
MQIINNCVLLLKAEKSDESTDKYEVMLTERGFTVKHLKTLEFVYKSLNELKEKLENPQNYNGIIFTTPRSVRAVKEAIGNECLRSEWKDGHKLNYVVGEATFNAALNELGLRCKGQESGNANNLAELILCDKDEISKRFLFPCGNLKTDTLINRLSEQKIDVEAVTVYDTVPSCSLDEDFCYLTSDFTEVPEYFAYFSPSGVHNTVKYIEKLEKYLHLIKFIAIGPTTENALKQANLPVRAVAIKPTPHDLLNAILS